MKNWAIVYKTLIASRAEICRGVLNDRNIDAVIINKKDTTVHMSHGQIEVHVPRDQVLTAMKIINDEITFE